ncbi:MAG: hypothetical protein H6797_00145 [Candidatus Nomurabacteria bacterium]|nr:MAG: hypothetical protein H6797_00145 [Candidatus Nomurabacteria bacterium]
MAKLNSRYFMFAVLALFVIQALWIALSFRFSMLYDEAFHVDAIKLYSHQISPYITDQATYYDKYGSLSHGWATLFHYAMSFPYRLISVFTNDLVVRVISLRIIDIAMAATGVFLLSVLFRKMKIRQIYINITLLIYVLIPITPFVAATISYDNMLLPLTALYFIMGIDLLKKKKVDATDYLRLIIIGCIASLVKFTFLPIFAASVLFIAVFMYKKHSKAFFVEFIKSLKKKSKKSIYVLVSLTIIIVGWFSSIYLYNLAVYHAVNPECSRLMSEKRCESSGLVQRKEQALAIRNELKQTAMNADQYIQYWVSHMINWSVTTGARPSDGGTVVAQPIKSIYKLIYIASFVGFAILLYSWRSLHKDEGWYFLVTITASLTLAEFLQNYLLYQKLLYPFSIQPRYFLSVVPIVIVMCMMACAFVLRKVKPEYKLLVVAVFFMLMTQGGGLTTHILLSQDTWYWDNSTVRDVNDTAKKILHPLVIGS